MYIGFSIPSLISLSCGLSSNSKILLNWCPSSFSTAAKFGQRLVQALRDLQEPAIGDDGASTHLSGVHALLALGWPQVYDPITHSMRSWPQIDTGHVSAFAFCTNDRSRMHEDDARGWYWNGSNLKGAGYFEVHFRESIDVRIHFVAPHFEKLPDPLKNSLYFGFTKGREGDATTNEGEVWDEYNPLAYEHVSLGHVLGLLAVLAEMGSLAEELTVAQRPARYCIRTSI